MPARPRPLRARWAGRSPRPLSSRPAGGGRSSPRSAQSLFSPSGRVGEGEESAGGRRGDLTSGREVLSSRELSGRVSGPAGTRRAPPAPPAPCQDARHRARGRVDGKAARKSQCGAQEWDRVGRGARGTTWKVSFSRPGGGGGRRPGACDCGCVSSGVCEPRLLGGGRGPVGGNVAPSPPQVGSSLEALLGGPAPYDPSP